jgi:DNA-binding NarL/FixJ family response regulator
VITLLQAQESWKHLTRSEAETAELLANGYLVRDIAVKRTITEYTVRTHIQKCLQKFGLHRQHQLVAAIWMLRAEIIRGKTAEETKADMRPTH